MNLKERVYQHFTDSIQTQHDSLDTLSEPIEVASQAITQSLLNNGKIISAGNGGSAALAQNFSSQMINPFERERPSLPAITLSTNSATLTSISNDHSYSDVFSKQLRALGQQGDIFLAYSTSGNSSNIIEAIHTAHDRGLTTIALTGKDGGQISTLLQDEDIELRVPSNSGLRIQETHLLMTHCLCNLIDFQLFG